MMNRRQALQTAAAAIAATLLVPSSARSQSRPLRVLILGGTGFIGPHFVQALQAGGHAVTLFNRGRRSADSVSNVEILIGDRNGKLEALENRHWDAVIDNSGYLPRDVKLSTELLVDRVQQYVFVSSISAYENFNVPGIDENYALAQLKDPETQEITNESYGGLKALCEQIVERAYGERAAIVRPTYIVGPGDTSDRFTYWPVRVQRGGDMLAPGAPADPIQFIDVRDLAQFMRALVERRIAGRFNACNPPGAVTIGNLLETSKRLTASDARFHWADASFLAQHELIESGEIPIWAPPAGNYRGAALVSSARAVANGLRFRDLETTVRDTLAWHGSRPAEQRKLRAGLSSEREKELLKQLQAQSPA